MRDLNETTITDAVLGTLSGTPSPRLRAVLSALAQHLHGFVREVEPTEAEWMEAIAFLTRTGQTCTDVRQEFILLSDTLGVTMLVDAINHRVPGGATENSVLGPFFFADRPTAVNGSDISGGLAGEPLYFEGLVTSHDGRPVAGAGVDVWHSDADGHYDVMNPALTDTAMRALFRTDAAGRFHFWSVMPASYPIPTDGPVGDMLKATGRPEMRPAHVHVLVEAPGFERLTTMVFVEGDPFLDADPVFGVKGSLVEPFVRHEPGPAPDGSRRSEAFYSCRYRFGLAPAQAASMAAE